MRKILDLYQTTIGKKLVMASTGVVLLLFVLGHMFGNLKIFYGEEKFNHYAEWLRVMGAPLLGPTQGLWLARLVLLGCVLLHMFTALQLTILSYQAREVGYQKQHRITFSYASTTMRWGGVVILAFVIFHLLHLTFGSVHPKFVAGSVYANVINGFKVWPVAVGYLVAQAALGFHLYHGVWSGLQTFGIAGDRRQGDWRRPLSVVTALIVVVGYSALPISVMAGWLK
ncbi:MAG: hypothetical protein HJJLKODD_00630 [Phycisphaerae bacterium]|nr:hypothetical protein [Phycisphaerae bacterium]